MSDWDIKTLGEFLSLQRGYDLTGDERTTGNVPVMGAAGQNGFHGTAKVSGPGIVIGRSGGSFGKVHFVRDDFWPHNTAMYVTDFKNNDINFSYYFLKNLDFNRFNSGSDSFLKSDFLESKKTFFKTIVAPTAILDKLISLYISL